MRKLALLLGLVACSAAIAVAALASGVNPSFSFSTDEQGATFACSLDGGASAACTSPQAYQNLSPGQHAVTIVGTFTVPQPASPLGAAFTITPNPAVAGQPTAFDASASTCDVAPCTFRWTDPGDGQVYSTAQSFSYTFSSQTPHQMQLTLTNASGATDSVTQSFNVVAAPAPPPPSGFCTNSAAFTNLTTGPHLCGWPDSTNTGYQNAPGYPGSLTTASSTSTTCPLPPVSGHTYQFCRYAGLTLPANLTNVTFLGDDFKVTAPQNANVFARSGDNAITFSYDTFQPNVAAPPVSCTQSYQYGIYDEGGAMAGYTVSHSDFWGFGNAIDTSGSTQANPQIFRDNWVHDTVTTGGCGYHNDGIGYEGGTPGGSSGSEKYAITDHNTIQMVGNTETIAWQEGTYANDQNTNNLLSGLPYAGGRCTGSECSAPTGIVTTGNTFSTMEPEAAGNPVIDGATNFWSGPGDQWSGNFWAVPPGAPWGTPAYNGYFWVPTGNSSTPQDCGFVSATDFPNYHNPC